MNKQIVTHTHTHTHNGTRSATKRNEALIEANMWMVFKNIMLSKKSQAQNDI